MPLRSAIQNASQYAKCLFGNSSDLDWQVVIYPLPDTRQPQLPVELQYAIAVSPSRIQILERLLDQSCGLIVYTYKHTPENILNSVRRISKNQSGSLFPWLSQLASQNFRKISNLNLELLVDQDQDVDLQKDFEDLKVFFNKFVQCQITHPPHVAVTDQDSAWLDELNQDIRSLYASRIPSRISLDLFFPPLWQTVFIILFALIVLSPLIGLLESFSYGLSKTFAAFITGASIFALETYHLYVARASQWQIRKRLLKLLPFLFISLLLAYSVQLFLDQALYLLAGAVFALAIILVPSFEFVKSIRGKAGYNLLDIYGPVGWLMPTTLILPLILTSSVFAIWPSATEIAWVLALLSVQLFILQGILALIWNFFEKRLFVQRIKRLFGQNIVTSSRIF